MDAVAAVGLVNRIYARLEARRGDVRKAEEYLVGKQPLNFATKEWREANAARYASFSDNWCGTVVSAEAERLNLIGFTLPGQKRAGSKLWDDLQRNEFDMQFSQGTVTALTTGRAFGMVWGDRDDNPVVSIEHPEFVEVEYSFENPRERVAALKTWVDERNEYATLYTPEWVWKFQRKRFSEANERESQAKQSRDDGVAGGWEPRQPAGDDSWPLKNPLGVVPVVELPNRPTLKGDPISEIAGVMPMQDAINLLWAYLFLAADYASMKARVVTGSDAPKIPLLDDEGNQIGTRPLDLKDFAEKRIAFLPGDAKIDEWEAAALDVFTDVIEIAVGHIAVQTRTPQHYLVTQTERPSAAFEAQEAGLTKKALEFQRYTNPQLREIARLMALVKGDRKAAGAAALGQWHWANPAIRSEAQLSDALLKKKQIGYSMYDLLILDGKSPAEAREMIARAREEAEWNVGAAFQGVYEGGLNGSVGAD